MTTALNLYRETIYYCIKHYMKDTNLTTIDEFNRDNDFTPLKTALLPFLIASSAKNPKESFEMYAPWKLQEILPKEKIREPNIRIRRVRFPGSTVVPYIDWPDKWVEIGYVKRYQTVAPDGFVENIKTLFKDFKENSTLTLSSNFLEEFNPSQPNVLITETLDNLSCRENGSPLLYEMKTLSCLLDKSFCFMLARMFSKVYTQEAIPSFMFIDVPHTFAHNSQQRFLI